MGPNVVVMSDDNTRRLHALPHHSLWFENEDPTAILGDPWGLRSDPPARSQRQPAPDEGRFSHVLHRLQQAVQARPAAQR